MTKLYNNKKIIPLIMCLVIFISTLSGFTYADGFGSVYYKSEKEIFKDISFGEIEGSDSNNKIQHAYIVETNGMNDNVEAMVFTGEVRATYKVSDMIKYAEEQGYKVIAAINGDIFDTYTGTPKGFTISKGNIVTSGYAPEMSLTFDEDGKASMKDINVSFKLKGMMNKSETIIDENIDKVEDTTNSGEILEGQMQAKEFETNIGFFNVPQGGAKGLHLFNRHYSKSTKTNMKSVEVVIDTGSKDNIQLKVNNSIKGIVKSVSIDVINTPIGESEVVLSTVSDSNYAEILKNMAIGSQVEISTKDNNDNGLENIKDAMGIYYSIVRDGKIDTTGTNPNPRTAVGIKKDGSLMLYVLDGRQPALSNGLGLINTAKHLIDLGCYSAFNMDGGGSSVLYARMPGIENVATIKNSPSQLSERSVSNGLLLVYKDTTSKTAKNLHIYPELTLLMPGGDVKLSAYASNELYEKVSLNSPISYSIESKDGKISSDGIFTAGDNYGRITINGESGRISGTTEVEIINPDKLNYSPSVVKLSLDTGQSVDINMIVKTGVSKVNSKDSLFRWECDPQIGEIDEEGVFKAGILNGQKGNIKIGYNGSQILIPVTVGSEIIEFYDTKEHWAKDYIGKMASRGFVAGVGDNMFMPDSSITRAQFLAMLAKTVSGLDIKSYPETKFIDVPKSEWYYDYINWGYSNSIVNGIDDETFAPNDKITREQMTIMLCNFSRALGFAIPQIKSGTVYPDSERISYWASDYVATVVGAGIMNGDITGYFYPQGFATRAEAVKVVYVFKNIKDGVE